VDHGRCSVHDTLHALGIRLIVARAKSTVRDALRRNGIVDVLGEDNLASSVDLALDAIEAGRTSSPPHSRAETGSRSSSQSICAAPDRSRTCGPRLPEK
jgi:hypothetical protein